MPSLATTNGMTIDDLSVRPNGPGLVQQLGNEVDAFYGSKVAAAANLPASGKFLGQRVWLIDVKGWAVWNGSIWVTDTALIPVTYAAGWGDGIAGGEVSEYERRNGEVTLYLAAIRSTNDAHAAGSPVLTLPGGFRPRRLVHGNGNNAGVGRPFTISTSGVLSMDVAQAAGAAAFIGSITFPAAV